MAGLESDSRAGATRVDPNSIVAKAGDLTPNIQMLSEAFNKGFVNTQQIMDRFSSKNIAQDEAATAAAKLSTQESTEIGPLAINARKAQLNPALVAGQEQVALGDIDAKLAEQDVRTKTRKQRDKIFQAQVGQALDEITQHLPASQVAQLNNQFPQLGAKFDDDGRVINGDEVRSKMPDILNYQKFLDASSDLTSQFETRQVELQGGAKGIQTFWKNTNRPVPPAIVAAATGAKEARFGAGFSETGTIPEPGQFAGAQPQPQGQSFGSDTEESRLVERRDIPAAGGSFTPKPLRTGDVTEEGIFVTGEQADARGKPTEIQARGAKFYRRMSVAENQYTGLLQTGFDPTGTQNNVLKDILGASSRVPVLRSLVSARTPPEVIEYDQVLKNYTSAILRDESGAAIKDEERAEYERMFFPIAGESELTSSNKAAQRASAAAALKAVADGDMSDEKYEQLIEGMTGRQFPVSTSVRSVSDIGNGTFSGGGPVLDGNTQIQTPVSPSDTTKVEKFQPGKRIPAEVNWINVNGRIMRRKQPAQPVPGAAPSVQPAPTPVPSASIEAKPLILPSGQAQPFTPFEQRNVNAVSGIRG
jgi:hypothetical protein